MQNKRKNKEKGITLVALVVTIIVLLILAGVTITSLLGEDGIIAKAQRAAEETNSAVQSEQEGINTLLEQLNNYGNGNSSEDPVTNPYGEDWDYAWVCNDGVWDNTQYTAGSEVTGEIIAKFYATEKQIQPPTLTWYGYEIPFAEGTEYHLVIEGIGDMGRLVEISGSDITNANASGWQVLTLTYFIEYMLTQNMPTNSCIMPYVTEIIICDGITNIGDFAFAGDTALNKITISNTVKNLGKDVLSGCKTLENITIPDSVTSIGYGAFEGCVSLVDITIPRGVTSIGNNVFYNCTSLAKVKILTTNLTTVGLDVFDDMGDNSVIYVLSEEIKTKLEGTYDSTKTTVQVITKEEMNKI